MQEITSVIDSVIPNNQHALALLHPQSGQLVSKKIPGDLMDTKEVCEYLNIGISTFFDWRKKNGKRFSADLPQPIYLSRKTVRYSRQEIIDWAMSRKGGSK